MRLTSGVGDCRAFSFSRLLGEVAGGEPFLGELKRRGPRVCRTDIAGGDHFNTRLGMGEFATLGELVAGVELCGGAFLGDCARPVATEGGADPLAFWDKLAESSFDGAESGSGAAQ